MDWVVLVLSGGLEAVWALALDRAEGFTRLLPSVVFIVALAASMLGLSYAVRTIHIGTAYAVWVGIGAALTVGYSILSGSESFSLVKLLLIAGLIACVVGLKIVGESQ